MNTFDPKNLLRTTRIIYFGLVFMPVLFAVAIFTMLGSEAVFKIEFEDPMILAMALLNLLIIIPSIIVPKKIGKTVHEEDPLQHKLTTFQRLLIIKASLWIGAANFAIVVALLTKNYFPFAIAILDILVVASLYPNRETISRLVPLKAEETHLTQ